MTTLRASAGLLILLASLHGQVSQDWTHYVRIAGNGLRLSNADQIVRSATATNVFGIEVDNDIPGRYESFVDPTEKLQATMCKPPSTPTASRGIRLHGISPGLPVFRFPPSPFPASCKLVDFLSHFNVRRRTGLRFARRSSRRRSTLLPTVWSRLDLVFPAIVVKIKPSERRTGLD